MDYSVLKADFPANINISMQRPRRRVASMNGLLLLSGANQTTSGTQDPSRLIARPARPGLFSTGPLHDVKSLLARLVVQGLEILQK